MENIVKGSFTKDAADLWLNSYIMSFVIHGKSNKPNLSVIRMYLADIFRSTKT